MVICGLGWFRCGLGLTWQVDVIKNAFKFVLQVFSVVPRSRFLGDTGVPLLEFQGDIYKFLGTHQIFQFFTC